MKQSKRICEAHRIGKTVLLAFGVSMLIGCASVGIQTFDLDGHAFSPLDLSSKNGTAAGPASTATAIVLLFIGNDCPISNRYAPEIERLKNLYAPRGVQFWLVHGDPTESAAAIREHDKQFGLTAPALRDPAHQLVDRAHAKVTPTASVFTPAGALIYHGRIDDRVSDIGRERPEPTRRDLVEALDAILAGRTAAEPEAPAVGCDIPGPQH